MSSLRVFEFSSFRVFEFSSFEFRVSSFEFRVSSFEFRVSSFEFRVSGYGKFDIVGYFCVMGDRSEVFYTFSRCTFDIESISFTRSEKESTRFHYSSHEQNHDFFFFLELTSPASSSVQL